MRSVRLFFFAFFRPASRTLHSNHLQESNFIMKEIIAACGETPAKSGHEPFRKELEDGVRKLIKDIRRTRKECTLENLKHVQDALIRLRDKSVPGQSAMGRIMEIRVEFESIRIVLDGFMKLSKSTRLGQLRIDLTVWIQKIDAELEK